MLYPLSYEGRAATLARETPGESPIRVRRPAAFGA
jgi:hypothetical protein